MTEELKQAAQAALEQLEFLNACYPHKTATDASDALRRALTQRPAAQEVARFEAGCNVLEYLKQEGAPYRITSQMLIALHGDPEGRPAPQQATPEPVGEVMAWLYAEDGETKFGHPRGYRPDDARPLVFGDTRPAPGVPPTKDQIREVFIGNGFTVKEGQADLKPYVYAAADALLKLVSPSPGVPEGWRIFRTHDGLDVHTPDGDACYVESKATGDRRIPEEVLHALCCDLLAAAQAKGAKHG